MTLAAADDLRHPAPPGARQRDSLFWQVTLPEERLGVQLYLPIGGRRAGWNLAVWGDGIGRLGLGDGPVLDLGSAELAEGADLDDLVLDGGDAGRITVAHDEPLRSVRIAAATPRIALDATFAGRHPAFSYRENPDGLPTWFAIDRFEQTGRLVGTLRIGDHAIALDAPAHRDHSWGGRDWRMPQHWTWFVAYAGERSVNGWIWIARGAWGFAGYVADGAEVVPIERIEHRLRLGDDGDQQGLDATVIDVRGRRTRVELASFGVLRLPDERSGSEVREAACTARIDGVDGAGQLECEWPIDYLRHLAG
jgi:hypothetical protein